MAFGYDRRTAVTQEHGMEISDSMHTILSRQEVVTDLFYLKFLDRYPDVQKFFQDVDLEQQAVLLKMALQIVVLYYVHRYPAAEQYLRVLGRKHCDRQIPMELYADWRDCLLDTLEQFHGDEWNERLETQWTDAVNLATDAMRGGYTGFATY
jgi:hemoglobin-like flavoprotein